MSEETTQPIPEILQKDLRDVSTDLPVLAKGVYNLTVRTVQLAPTEKGGQVVKIALTTMEPAVSTRGEQVGENYPIFDNISITPTADYPVSQIERRLAAFRKACLGDTAGSFFPLDQYVGCVVKASVKVQPPRDDYPERNAISRYLAPDEE